MTSAERAAMSEREEVAALVDDALNSAIPEPWEVASHCADRIIASHIAPLRDQLAKVTAELAESRGHENVEAQKYTEACIAWSKAKDELAKVTAERDEREAALADAFASREKWRNDAHQAESSLAAAQARIAQLENTIRSLLGLKEKPDAVVASDAQVQEGQAALGLEKGPEGQEAQTGNSDHAI